MALRGATPDSDLTEERGSPHIVLSTDVFINTSCISFRVILLLHVR